MSVSDFLEIALGYPTAIFSILLVLIVLYWLFVVIGAMDIDLFEGGAEGAGEGAAEGLDGVFEGVGEGGAEGLEGVFEGAGEGAAEGLDGVFEGVGEGGAEGLEGVFEGAGEGAAEAAAEGAAEAAAEGAAEAAAEGAGEGVAEGVSPSGLAGFLSALKLRSAPVTVVASLLVLYTWIFCYFVMSLLSPVVAGGLSEVLVGTGVMGMGLFGSLLLTSLSVRPMGRFFTVHSAEGRASLVGRVCTVTTGRVDLDFGQAEVEADGASPLIQVRCEDSGALGRGDEALIVSYDQDLEAFLVEPMAKLLEQRAEDRAAAFGASASASPPGRRAGAETSGETSVDEEIDTAAQAEVGAEADG